MGFEATSWVAVVAPAGTLAPIMEKISAAFGEAMKETSIIEGLADWIDCSDRYPDRVQEVHFRRPRQVAVALAKEAKIVAQ